MESGAFIGRGEELERVLEDLGSSPGGGEKNRSLVVWGPGGIGKSRFTQEIITQLLGLNTPYYWFGLGLRDRPAELDAYALALVESFQSNHIAKEVPTAELIAAMQRLLPRPNPSSGETAVPTQINITPIELAEVLVDALFQSFYGVGVSHKEGLIPQWYTLLFIMEDYDSMSLEHKGLWLSFQERIARESAFFNTRFLILSRQNPAQLGWSSTRGNSGGLMEIRLNPFNREEASEFLGKLGLPEGSHAAIYEKTGGVPGLLEQHARIQSGAAFLADQDTGAIHAFIQSMPSNEREYLIAAAFLGMCDPEGLSLFGGLDFGKRAFVWLQAQPASQVRPWLDGTCELHASLSKSVRQFWEEQQPEKAKEFAQRVEIWRQWRQLIPDPNHRRWLRQLAPFARFTKESLQLALPEAAAELWSFSEQFPSYFVSSPYTRGLVDTLKPVAQSCGYWTDPSSFEQTQSRLMEIWKKHRKSIVEEIGTLEKELAENERQRQDVCAQIQEIQHQIEGRIQEVARALPSPPPAPIRRVPRRSLKSSLAIQGVGIASIYAGFLLVNSAREMAYSYIGLGLYLFVWGIVISVSPKSQLNACSPEGGAAVVTEESFRQGHIKRAENDLNLVRLRSITLENRQKSLFSSYARHNRRLNECYERLNEAFV